MATIPPADITTMPGSKVVFNAPFDDKRTYYVKVIWGCKLLQLNKFIIFRSSTPVVIASATRSRLPTPDALEWNPPLVCSTQRRQCSWRSLAIRSTTLLKTSTTTASQWNGPTLPRGQPSSSAANGSRETGWCAARISPSSTTCRPFNITSYITFFCNLISFYFVIIS